MQLIFIAVSTKNGRMSYLNINNEYIITFGGGYGYKNNKYSRNIYTLYILDIKNNHFYKSNVNLEETTKQSGCFLDDDNTCMVHIVGGFETKSHYVIRLRDLVGVNLYDINVLYIILKMLVLFLKM